VGGAAPGGPLVGRQSPGDQVELFGRDQRGDRHGDPLLGRMRPGAHPPADRLQRRLAPPSRGRPQPTAGRLALVGRVGQQIADRRRPPHRPAGRGRHAAGGELRSQGVQGHPTGRIRGEQLLHNGGRDRVDPDRGGVTRPLGMQPVAVGCPRPRQQLPTAQPGLPPPPHPVSDQGPLVLGHRPADLGHQLLVRVVAERPITKHHPDATSLQLLQDHHLVHEVAGQPIWRGDHDHVEGCPRGMVAKRIQAARGPAWRRWRRHRERRARRQRSTPRAPRRSCGAG
jgi:hypothetical protein